MLSTLYSSLKQQTGLMHKFKNSSDLTEIEIYLLAKSNIKLLKEEIKKQIAFDAYWQREYMQRKKREYEIT